MRVETVVAEMLRVVVVENGGFGGHDCTKLVRKVWSEGRELWVNFQQWENFYLFIYFMKDRWGVLNAIKNVINACGYTVTKLI